MKDFGSQVRWKTGTEKSIHDFLICSHNCKYYTKSITHNYSSFLNILVGAEWNSNSLLGGLLSFEISEAKSLLTVQLNSGLAFKQTPKERIK